VAQLAEEYSTRYKCAIACYKAEFVSLEAFLKYACGVNIIDEKVCLSTSSTNIASWSEKATGETSSSVHLVSKPQFSSFFGFSDGDKNKGVAYNVWRFEVESVMKGAFYPDEVILEQIRRSLQGEAKAKNVGFGSETSCESILGKLDQFYSDVGAATGDELLAEAYQMKQGENEEVAAFASRLGEKTGHRNPSRRRIGRTTAANVILGGNKRIDKRQSSAQQGQLQNVCRVDNSCAIWREGTWL
jgi:hypothetical protein